MLVDSHLVDSHCHLDFPELEGRLPELLDNMATAGVGWALCAGVTLERFPAILALARAHPNLFAAVGVHPDHQEGQEPDVDTLIRLSAEPKVVAIGETGLDYYRLTGDMEWQRSRFRIHIAAAKATGKPLIIHTRSASRDTLDILAESGSRGAGGVLHCFTEDWETARSALDMGFHISFSGIITFKNAAPLREVVRQVPLDRMLVETDSPYLAPTPHRGKTNEPSYVRHVAEEVARIKDLPYEQVAQATTDNFFKLFSAARPENA